MPRLPDADSLGARRAPVSRRPIASVRNAGAVADAVGNIGGQVADYANDQLEREDKLTYAAAKTAVLRADMLAREELKDDPDYASYETKYQQKMDAARQQATSLIGSRLDRRLFEVDSRLDLERGATEVRKMARDRGRADRVATLNSGLVELQGVGRAAMDDATRETTIATAADLIDGAMKTGDIGPLEAVEFRQKWTGGYAREQIVSAVDRGDIDGARGMMAKFGKFLSSDDYISLNGAIDEEEDGRAIIAAADVATGSAPTLPGGGRDAVSVIKSLFPGVHITDTKRDPNSALGRKNPGSYHNVGRAVDMRPIPGVTFEEVKVQLKANGVDLVEAIDEVKNPSKHATGPHWHFAWKPEGAGSGGYDTIEAASQRAVDALGPNATAKQVAAVRREVETRFQLRDNAEKEREENSVESAQELLLKNGGNWYALPASIRRSIPAKYHPALINFGEGLRPSAPARKTNPEKYVELSEQAATNPRAFAAINPIEYRSQLDDGDWNRFVQMRSDILGNKGGQGDAASITEVRSIVKPALEAAGVSTRGLRTKDVEGRAKVAARQYTFEKAVLGDLAIWQQNNPGKKPTALDIQKIADRRLIMMTPATGGDPVPQFEAQGPSKVRLPNAEITRIRRVMTPILGREPSEQEIVQAYLREARGGL